MILAIEVIAALSIFGSAVLAWEEKPISFLLSAIGSLLYTIIFITLAQPANVSIHFIFVIVSLWGFIHWKVGTGSVRSLTADFNFAQPVRILKVIETVGYCIGSIIFLGIVSFYFEGTLLDFALAATYMIGTIFLINKYIEAWVIFILVDIAYIPYLIQLDLPWTIVLNVALTLNAIYGFTQWKKIINIR